MLTEEQLAALIDSLSNVERLVLVGDPRQLPPIGAGRPFVDIVRELEPEKVEARSFRAAGRAMPSSQFRDASRARPGPTCSWHRTSAGGRSILAQTPCWTRARKERTDASASCGGTTRRSFTRSSSRSWSRPSVSPGRTTNWASGNRWAARVTGTSRGPSSATGSATTREPPRGPKTWQMLSPVRAGLVGVDALNRMLQTRFRAKARELAETEGWRRKVPRPVGPQTLLYGDKVINVINQRRRDVWPKPAGEAYVANGDIGIVVGQYKTKKFKGLPWKLEVEFAGQPGPKYGFYRGEFGDEGPQTARAGLLPDGAQDTGQRVRRHLRRAHQPLLAALPRALVHGADPPPEPKLVILHEGPLVEYRRYGRRRSLGDRPAHDEPLCGSAAARSNRQRPASASSRKGSFIEPSAVTSCARSPSW